MNFSQKIKMLRREKGLTQVDLSKISGLTSSCIAMIETEKNEPTARTLIALSKALNVSTDYLLGVEDDFGNAMGESALTKDEQRLLNVFCKLNDNMKEKLIKDAEFYAGLDDVKK